MLVEFTVENFMSFREPQTLSLVATGREDLAENEFHAPNDIKLRLLKSAIVYGANASGKSNLIMALDGLRFMILESTAFKLDQKIPVYKPHQLSADMTGKPVRFEIEFIAEDCNRYRYTLSFLHDRITHEELVFFPNRYEKRLFRREEGKDIVFGEALRGKKRTIESDLLPNMLFLSKAANSNQDQLQVVYRYFMNSIQPSTSKIGGDQYINNISFRNLRKSPSRLKMLEDFIRKLDVGIEGLRFKEINIKNIQLNDLPDEVKDKLLEELTHRLVATHSIFHENQVVGNVEFNIHDESAGTQRLCHLGPRFLSGLEHGNCMVFDEIDTSLHPQLTMSIIELFHNSKTNPKNAQLIMTSHDVALLTPNLFRRDQIWFMEKDTRGGTQLFSLAEFDKNIVRKDKPFGEWYLDGRFGAIPHIKLNRHIDYCMQESDSNAAPKKNE